MDILHNIADLLTYDPQSPLIFSSGLFWALFLVFLPLYALCCRRLWQMVTFVVLFSLYFYYKSSGVFVLMLLTTAMVDWVLSKAMVEETARWRRRLCLVLSLSMSLGLLAYFKYANFFLWNWNAMVRGNYQPLDLILPVGISFYTFQSASYIIDIYKRKIRQAPTLLEYIFFLTYFPALVAGPIVRADYFLPQIRRQHRATRFELYSGLWLIIIGVLKKALIADYLAQYNDLVFASPGTYNGFETLMGLVGYVMQIYCDFSGYSDMAIGISLIMGFKLAKNFDFPYKSRNISDFWRRWHISLSSWLRDYIYIPLGGNRKGVVRSYVNNFITMLAAGLWHGAGWKFILWGAMHGVGLIVHKALRPWLSAIHDTWAVKAVSWTLMMGFFTFTLTYFRAESVSDAHLMLWTILTDFQPGCIGQFVHMRYMWLIMMAVIITAHALPTRWWDATGRWFVRTAWPVKLLVLFLAIQLVIEFRSWDVVPFIYYNF